MTLDRRVKPIAPNVWVYRHDWARLEPAIGMILTDEGWVAVDGGNSPRHAQQVAAAMRSLCDMPVRYVVNTHRHFDHVFGNQKFNAPVIGSRRCQERFLENIKDDWSAEKAVGWLKATIFTYNDQLNEGDFEGYSPVPPSESFVGEHTLSLPPLTLKLFPLDGVHTDDGIGVWVPERRVVFLSDAFYHQPFTNEGVAANLLLLVERVAVLDAEWFVPGHERLFNRETFEKFHRYVRWLFDLTSSLPDGVNAKMVAQQHPFPPEYKNVSFLDEKIHYQLLKALLQER